MSNTITYTDGTCPSSPHVRSHQHSIAHLRGSTGNIPSSHFPNALTLSVPALAAANESGDAESAAELRMDVHPPSASTSVSVLVVERNKLFPTRRSLIILSVVKSNSPVMDADVMTPWRRVKFV